MWHFNVGAQQELKLSIENVEASQLGIRGVQARLSGESMNNLQIDISMLRIRDKILHNIALTCSQFRMDRNFIRCDQGMFSKPEKIPLSFIYDTEKKSLQLSLRPTSQEIWSAKLEFGERKQLFVEIVNGGAKRLSDWLPIGLPKVTKGTLDGQFNLMGPAGAQTFSGNLQLNEVDFSDETGLHAGQKLTASIQISGQQQGQDWNWNGVLDWQKGEVFWQPLYFPSGGHRVTAQGSWDQRNIQVKKGKIELNGLGEIALTGIWNKEAGVKEFDLKAEKFNLAQAYLLLLKPFFENTVIADLQADGIGDLIWQFHDKKTKNFKLVLRGANIKDNQNRFAINGLDLTVPWQPEKHNIGNIHIGSGTFRELPLGKTDIIFNIEDSRVRLPRAVIPILDGKFTLDNFSAEPVNGEWQWEFKANLTAIAMEQLTKAFNLPEMHGSLSATIPKVSYDGSTVNVDGALLFKVFDGTIIVRNLKVINPVGRTPILTGDLDAQQLDLDLLTRAFSFGNMQGRIDAKVSNMEMINWQPQRFDAFIGSSSGSYTKKISQKAVENISSLGGAGGAVALQKSFLRFFEHFGYEKIGLSCVLRKGVCKMDGVEPAPQGYVIVKGGGIPAITVIGYNREVGWTELLERLERITTENLKPVIQ